MASSSSSRSLKYSTDYSTRSQGAVERMNDIYTGFINNHNISDFTIIHELSLLFPPVNFNSISPPQPCILAGANTEPRGVLKQVSYQSNLTWADVENIPDHPLFNITEGSKYSVTREFNNSMQGNMVFVNCVTSF